MIEQLKAWLIAFARIWGFCYPSKVLIVMDPTTGKKRIIEKFTSILGIKRKYKLKAEAGDKGSKSAKKDALIKTKANNTKEKNDKDKENTNGNNKTDAPKPTASTGAKANGNGAKAAEKAIEDMSEDELKDLVGDIDIEKGFSTVTDLKTFSSYVIAGKVETFFRARKPVEVFPSVVLAVFLPILLITEVWQVALIYNLHFDEVLLAAAFTACITLTVHNARYAYGSGVEVLYATMKTSAGGEPLYIPNMIEFLNFKQSRNQDLRDDLLSAAYAKLRPLELQNAKLMASLEKSFKAWDMAKAEGARTVRTTGISRLQTIAPYWAIILIFAVGIIFGWILSGGVSVFPPTNSTLANGSGAIMANPVR